ncbi:hypothetical protein EsH8_I_000505 [Colletotrichum jinshuiense]
MSSTAPAHGSAHTGLVRITDRQDAQAQRSARLQQYHVDHSLARCTGYGAAQQGPSQQVNAAIASVDQLGLGAGGVGGGAAGGLHNGNMPVNLRGVGAQFPN